MNSREAYQIRPQGLGIIITQLSFILATGRPVTAVVSNSDNVVHDLKRIFCIPDNQLVIETGTHGHADLETDELCTYAPYFHSDAINLFGRTYITQARCKPAVALCMHHGQGLGQDLAKKIMPYNKFATAEEYEAIFTKLTNMGYDVITMNQPDLSVEHKCFLLNECCDFVIGYEGGLQHLAHVLKIPVIVLPWRYNDSGGDAVYPGMWYETHRFHVDPRTWFLNSADEFLSWTPSQLQDQINRLHQLGGNNILFDTGQVCMDPNTLQISHANGMDLTPRIMWCKTRGKHTTAFIKEHLPVENMVKYPLKSTTYNT